MSNRGLLPEPWLQDPDVTLYHGDVLDVLRELPAESVDCCVTSPPYWGLRDYGQEGQLGLEPTPEEYVTRMVEVFREVRRVLAAHGTVWLNLGSSYFQGESYPLREIDAAWLAAIIDGEGCIQIHQQRRPPEKNCVDSFQVDLGVGMMTPEVVQRCHEITGLGSCKEQARGVWDWSVRGQQAAQLLRAIYPYLIGKKKQAALAIMLADDLAARKYGRGNPAQPDVMEWRAQIRKAVSDCNQRRGTDFPISEPRPIVLGLKAKDDCMIPARVALALQADGWYLRSEIVWGKLNPMPESVTDRPTKAHEMVYLLSKQPRYFFDQEAVREKAEWARWGDQTNGKHEGGESAAGWIGSKSREELQRRASRPNFDGRRGLLPKSGDRERAGGESLDRAGTPNGGRNIRSVWEIATQPYPDAHFATFPEELARRCVAAGCPEQVCRVCGNARERVVEHGAVTSVGGSSKGARVQHMATVSPLEQRPDNAYNTGDFVAREKITVGFTDCGHSDYRPGVVLDPFMGSGTVAYVARKLGRRSVGIDLNESYLELAARRLQQQSLFAEAAS